jgi:hypothetical protein
VAHAGTRALNPQPLPPGMKARVQVQVNPQPLPPQAVNVQRSAQGASAAGKAALNPQPLPPGFKYSCKGEHF